MNLAVLPLANPYMNCSIGEPVADDSEARKVKRPAVSPPSLSRFVMIFLGLLAIWVLFDPGLASSFAALADLLLWPVIGFGGYLPVMTILLAGALTTTISSLVRDYFTDYVRMARTQKIMRAWQKERMDAMRKGNTARIAKLMEAQKSFQKDQMDMMFSPYKSMALTLFMFVIIFTWLRTFVDQTLGLLGNQWIAVPWASDVFLPSTIVFLPAWILLYSGLAIPIGQIVTRVLKYVRFRRRLLAMDIPLHPEADDAA